MSISLTKFLLFRFSSTRYLMQIVSTYTSLFWLYNTTLDKTQDSPYMYLVKDIADNSHIKKLYSYLHTTNFVMLDFSYLADIEIIYM